MHELQKDLLTKPGIKKPGKKTLGGELADIFVSEEKMKRTFDLVISIPMTSVHEYIELFYKTKGYTLRENPIALIFVKEREAIAVIISELRDRVRFSVDHLGS